MIVLAISLLALSGCAFLPARMELYPADVVGEIDIDGGGFLITWSVTGGPNEPLVVHYGDGEEDIIEGDSFTVEHLYKTVGTFKAEFWRGRAYGKSAVTVTGPGFKLNQPFWTQGSMAGKWEEILFNPFPRQIGCDNGTEIYRTGLWVDDPYYQKPGPFGDKFDTDKLSEDFEMRIYVTTTDGGGGSAYGKGGEVITGEWVHLQTFRVIADWPWAKPPYPLIVLPKTCELDDPWIPPAIPADAGYFLVRQEVRSVWGEYDAAQWNIYVSGGCSNDMP